MGTRPRLKPRTRKTTQVPRGAAVGQAPGLLSTAFPVSSDKELYQKQCSHDSNRHVQIWDAGRLTQGATLLGPNFLVLERHYISILSSLCKLARARKRKTWRSYSASQGEADGELCSPVETDSAAWKPSVAADQSLLGRCSDAIP